MQKELDAAIDLRRGGKLKQYSDLLARLVQEFPDHAIINY